MEINWNMPAPVRHTADKLLAKIRFKLNDTTISKHSDTELLIAMNEGIQLLWQALSAHYSTLTHKIQGYDLRAGTGQLLPHDFNSLVKITGTTIDLRDVNPGIFDTKPGNAFRFPRIEGEYILGTGSVRLVYNYLPDEVTLPEDVVDIPVALEPDVVAITANIITQNMDAARQRVDEAAKRVSQFREYSHIPRKKAFP